MTFAVANGGLRSSPPPGRELALSSTENESDDRACSAQATRNEVSVPRRRDALSYGAVRRRPMYELLPILRIVLIMATAALLVGWCLLAVVADRFRRSFGASRRSGTTALPALALAIMLAALLAPSVPALLHAGAALALAFGLVGLSALVRNPRTAAGVLAYVAAWAVFYAGMLG